MLAEVKSARQAALETANAVEGMTTAVEKLEYRNIPDDHAAGHVVVARMRARQIAEMTAELLRSLGHIERAVVREGGEEAAA